MDVDAVLSGWAHATGRSSSDLVADVGLADLPRCSCGSGEKKSDGARTLCARCEQPWPRSLVFVPRGAAESCSDPGGAHDYMLAVAAVGKVVRDMAADPMHATSLACLLAQLFTCASAREAADSLNRAGAATRRGLPLHEELVRKLSSIARSEIARRLGPLVEDARRMRQLVEGAA